MVEIPRGSKVKYELDKISGLIKVRSYFMFSTLNFVLVFLNLESLSKYVHHELPVGYSSIAEISLMCVPTPRCNWHCSIQNAVSI